MSEVAAVDVGRQMLKVAVLLCLPTLGTALLVGLVVSILQAVTQVNEMTLTFIPKLFMVGAVVFLVMPWMLAVLSEFTVEVAQMIGQAPRGMVPP